MALCTAIAGSVKNLQLLIFHGFWPTATNPFSTYAVEQVAAFTRLGCKVTLAIPRTLGRPTSMPLSIVAAGLDPAFVHLVRFMTVRLPESVSSWPGGMALNTWLAGQTVRRVIAWLGRRVGPFDGCIVHGARYCGWSLPAWRALVAGPVAVVLHGVEPFLERPGNATRARRIVGDAARAMDACVVVGTPLIAHAVALGVPANKISVVWNGTVLPELSAVSDRQRSLAEPRRIVSVSRLIPVKGIDHNLRALAALTVRRPDLSWRYHVVGDGDQRPHLERLARELGLMDRVCFLGMLEHSDAMREIAEADIFALPSWAEAFGLVYLEALARMRPAIGCAGQGAAEVIRDGQEGILVPPHGIEALATALERLIASPSLCQTLGHAGRSRAQDFTWEANVRALLSVLGAYREWA